jgi:hypothetical protein
VTQEPSPLVVIAAIRRTGSTLLSEALTQLPTTFVFREPGLFTGRLALKARDAALLAANGLDLAAASERRPPLADGRQVARRFRELVAEPAGAVLRQVGVKEIRYGPAWADVLDGLGPVRVVALARDPRDIYLSLASVPPTFNLRLDGPFGPETVARDIEREARRQQELIEHTGALRVRYEDLCSDPGVLDRIRAFVGSPVSGTGHIGGFSANNRAKHGTAITSRRVALHSSEPDPQRAADAAEVAARLEGYREAWGYP